MKYSEMTPEQRERRKAYVKAYYAANLDKYVEYKKAYYAAHREEIREYHKKWREAHPDYYKNYSRQQKEEESSEDQMQSGNFKPKKDSIMVNGKEFRLDNCPVCGSRDVGRLDGGKAYFCRSCSREITARHTYRYSKDGVRELES